LFRELRKLDIPAGDFAIFGSGPLIVRGVIPGANDLDVICRGPAWDYVESISLVQYLKDYDVTVATLLDGRLSFGTEWGIGQFNIDELIDEAETIDGLPFVRVKHVIAYKQLRGSNKDLQHLEAIRKSNIGSAGLPEWSECPLYPRNQPFE